MTQDDNAPRLARRLGLFDATMIVMNGIVGAGIFMNPHNVAQHVRTPALILGAWLLGGLVALVGAFVYAELAERHPHVGGQYAYLREAFRPWVAFLYGWALLLVVQTGGMAAVAVTFANYFLSVTRLALPESLVAALALALLTAVNCLGVSVGGRLQSALMVMKILAVAALVVCGLAFAATPSGTDGAATAQPMSLGLIAAFGAAMGPVMFAYGGWQTASFVAAEMRDPRRDLARGLLIGVVGVVLLYAAVNFVCVYVLGPAELARVKTPASAVMRAAFGHFGAAWSERGAALIAVGIAVSTLGFLSQGMLTAPRVYFAMADDGLFFKSVARVSERTRVPVVAIVLQGVCATAIALTGSYGQILSYVVSVDFIFFGLTAAALFVFRRRAKERLDEGAADKTSRAGFRVPGHPLTTAFFVLACALIVLGTVYESPKNSAVGFAILLAGVPAYLFWRGRSQQR